MIRADSLSKNLFLENTRDSNFINTRPLSYKKVIKVKDRPQTDQPPRTQNSKEDLEK